ncbi:hypothetical protein bcere0029_59950 [Bacillus cereus AH1272]|nr:hypothetical protein bcere0029_59950 [Bacillus cereus AH1272]EEL90195.1 hypothetical protein bcere0030_58700 [Bacillus cereus AH1273]
MGLLRYDKRQQHIGGELEICTYTMAAFVACLRGQVTK